MNAARSAKVLKSVLRFGCGECADDPLWELDDLELVGAAGASAAYAADCDGAVDALARLVRAAYSLGARHALELSPGRHVASNVPASDEEEVDLHAPVLPPPVKGGDAHGR